jgi:hypothetical protein
LQQHQIKGVSGRHFVRSVESARRWVGRTGIAPLLLLTATCLAVGEQYPFSPFPMYSSFSKSTYYIYLADGSGQPLATAPATGMSTPTLKKVFDGELRKERQQLRACRLQLGPQHREEVARRILARIKTAAPARGTAAALPPVLRLYQVNIRLAAGRYEKETMLLAEHP